MSAPDRWFVVSARVPSRDLLPLVAEGLLVLGGASVLEQGDSVSTFLPPPADPEAFAREAREQLAQMLPDGVPLEIEWRWHPNEDWAATWKQGLQPRRITERLVVKPTWTSWDAEPHQIVLDIDPQMAFGTGEHATTRGCLRLLDGVLRSGDRVLDVGSGSAILAIAAARLGAGEVIAVEYDPDANLNARENLEHNCVHDNVRVIEAMADAELLSTLGPFDVVLANILSSIIRPLLPAFHQAVRGAAEGRLIVSGILRSEHPDVVRDALAAGFRVERVDEEEEWCSALLVPAR
ncbi:50S ribosomal protein L11 methyltransferase [soil metagenome]|nr:50S ribosomal protein L11 methyltransferase [Gemmatimonadota bacterium]